MRQMSNSAELLFSIGGAVVFVHKTLGKLSEGFGGRDTLLHSTEESVCHTAGGMTM